MMKIGIIVVFYNNEQAINNNLFDGLARIENYIQLCLINNGSDDATINKLKELKDSSKLHIVILDIKQHKKINNAVKAGARYLFSQNEIKHIGYVNVSELNKIQDLHSLLQVIKIHKEHIINANIDGINKSKLKKVIYKNVFCVLDNLKSLNLYLGSG